MSQITAEQWCQKLGIRWQAAADAEALAESLAAHIALALQREIDATGAASLVVSGGSTPGPVFKRLSVTDIAWSKVSVTLADERWVPPGHADSNESLVRERLLTGLAAEARFVSLYRADMAPEEAVSAVASDVSAMAQPFTVVILGMGNDGHTASLFPDAPEAQLAPAMALENTAGVAILAPPSVPQTRISLTRAALLNSGQRILHMTGDGKRQVLADALEQSFTSSDMPGEYQHGMKPIVGLLTPQPSVVSVFWSA